MRTLPGCLNALSLLATVFKHYRIPFSADILSVLLATNGQQLKNIKWKISGLFTIWSSVTKLYTMTRPRISRSALYMALVHQSPHGPESHQLSRCCSPEFSPQRTQGCRPHLGPLGLCCERTQHMQHFPLPFIKTGLVRSIWLRQWVGGQMCRKQSQWKKNRNAHGLTKGSKFSYLNTGHINFFPLALKSSQLRIYFFLSIRCCAWCAY